jgi:hypothetical protein
MSRIWRNPNNLTSISFILLALAAGFAGAAFICGVAVLYIVVSVFFLLLAIVAFTKAFVEDQRVIEQQRSMVFAKAQQAAERN